MGNTANPNTNHAFVDIKNAPSYLPPRLLKELKILKENADVQSYFHYESSEKDEKSNRFCIYGYLLPQSELYKRRSYKVRIVLTPDFPFKSPELHLLTYIYHPAIYGDTSKLTFCDACCSYKSKPTFHISDVIKHYVGIIDRRGLPCTACTYNYEARELYDRNKAQYEEKVLAMVEKHGCPRPN